MSSCCQKVKFQLKIVEEITGDIKEPLMVYSDDNAAIFILWNQQVSQRTKHIDVRHHWIRDLQSESVVTVELVQSEESTSDMCTKNLPLEAFWLHFETLQRGGAQSWREDLAP